MTLVGIPKPEQDQVFATVAAVLHFGNTSFVPAGEDGESVQLADEASQGHLQVGLSSSVSGFGFKRLAAMAWTIACHQTGKVGWPAWQWCSDAIAQAGLCCVRLVLGAGLSCMPVMLCTSSA